MVIGEGLPFIKDYVTSINAAIKQQDPGKSLSRLQQYWLSFVILGILVTNTLCWERFERFGLGNYSKSALSWMFRKSQIAWELLLTASLFHIFSVYKVTSGVLIIDDSDKERSKRTQEIAKTHKIKDKKKGGYFNGQNILFLLLVHQNITLPVGFRFYEPDPKMVAWYKEDKRLKEKGIKKRYRPQAPELDVNYPTKKQLGLELLENFRKIFSHIKVKAVVADLYYGTLEFMEKAAEITEQPQVISQIKKTQLINVNGKNMGVGDFFKYYGGTTQILDLRGNSKRITYRCGKFKVKSHGKKYYIISLKYEGESHYRYVIAQDMTWQDVDIIKTFSLRWLVEVFIQDWKSYEGWNQLSKQRGIEGADRGVTLSLLCDHALLLHQEQQALFKDKDPAITVGCLREKVMMESLTEFIKGIVMSDNPKKIFEEYSDKICEIFNARPSIKHLRHVNMDFLPAELEAAKNKETNV